MPLVASVHRKAFAGGKPVALEEPQAFGAEPIFSVQRYLFRAKPPLGRAKPGIPHIPASDRCDPVSSGPTELTELIFAGSQHAYSWRRSSYRAPHQMVREDEWEPYRRQCSPNILN